MESVKFSDCSRELLENELGLQQITSCPILNQWLDKMTATEVDDFEMTSLERLQNIALYNFETWNEVELIEYFISPLLYLVNFNTPKFKIFSERKIQAQIDNYLLYGEPDALIATGRWTPKIPYFCFNEYKRQEESKGDAAGQALAAMLVAQELNQHQLPIYGIYVVGRYWNFMVLQNKDYCISKSYAADDEEIFDIFKILKALKEIILTY